MRGLLVIVAAIVLVGSAAAASVAPVPVRIATRADLAPRLTDAREYWLVRAFDPASKRMVEVQINYERGREHVGASVRVYNHGYGKVAEGLAGIPNGVRLARRTGPGVALDHGGILPTPTGWNVKLDYPTLEANLALRGVRPGVTAGPWRFGADPTYGAQTVHWSAPVAFGTATGSVKLYDMPAPVEVRGWRVVVEHVRQSLQWASEVWDYWDSVVVFSKGETWLLTGLAAAPPKSDSPVSARDGRTWNGLLARTTAKGTSICRPKVVRTVLSQALDAVGWLHPGRIVATCPGLRLGVRMLLGPTLWRGGHFTSFNYVSRDGGGIGMQIQYAQRLSP